MVPKRHGKCCNDKDKESGHKEPRARKVVGYRIGKCRRKDKKNRQQGDRYNNRGRQLAHTPQYNAKTRRVGGVFAKERDFISRP